MFFCLETESKPYICRTWSLARFAYSSSPSLWWEAGYDGLWFRFTMLHKVRHPAYASRYWDATWACHSINCPNAAVIGKSLGKPLWTALNVSCKTGPYNECIPFAWTYFLNRIETTLTCILSTKACPRKVCGHCCKTLNEDQIGMAWFRLDRLLKQGLPRK